MIDLEQQLTDVFSLVADSKPIPPVPWRPAPLVTRHRSTRLRKAVLTCTATITFAGLGLGAAAAAGLPLGFAWGNPVAGAFNAEPQASRLLLTTQDADGQPLQLWFTDAQDHGYCLAFVHPNANRYVRKFAGDCSGDVGDRNWKTFGTDASASSIGGSGELFAQHVPRATRVDMVLSDGTSVPLPVGDGWTVGYVTGSQEAQYPVLVGYNATDDVVGRAPVTATP